MRANSLRAKIPLMAVPRRPQPISPTVSAELACVPRTVWALRMVTPAAAAEAPELRKKSRRVVFSLINLLNALE